MWVWGGCPSFCAKVLLASRLFCARDSLDGVRTSLRRARIRVSRHHPESLASDTILPQRHHFMPRELPTTKTCHSCGHAQQKRVGNGKVVQPLESDVDMISQPSCGSIRTRHSRAARECTPITTSTTKALRILQPIAIHSLPTLSSLHGQLEAVKRGKCIVQRGGKSGKASAAASERHWMWLHLKCCHGNAVRTVKQTV